MFLTGLAIGGYRFSRDGYRDWKARRALLPAAERNSGFVTDRKITAFEGALRLAVIAWVLWIGYFIFLFVGIGRGWIDFENWPQPF